MFQTKTIGREFSIDLEDLKKDIENHYNFKVLTSLRDCLTGYINLNFPFESSNGKKIVRVFGDYSQRTQTELEVMKYLNDSDVPTSSPILNNDGGLTVKYGNYNYAIFDFITGERPTYVPETFYKIGNAVAKMQEALEKLPFTLGNDNRYFDIIKRKEAVIDFLEENKEILSSILPSEVYKLFDSQIDLFSKIEISSTHIIPTHSDIFNFNLLDDGKEIYILDFDYIGNGPSIIDTISYIALDSVTSDRTTNTPEVHQDEPTLLKTQIEAYLSGYTSTRNITFPPEEMFDALIFRNIVDDMYNLEKAVKMKENLFNGYINHWDKITLFKENKEALLKIFS